MARQSEKESAEKYALESLKNIMCDWKKWEKGLQNIDIWYMHAWVSQGEHNTLEKEIFKFRNCLTLRQLSYDSRLSV